MKFAEQLLQWYSENGRDLPWRHTNDPYVIWLSEIILQQTRIEQGMPYFYRFLDHFPTLSAFANADEGEILRLWQGLGYYSRARNMHKAAKQIMQDYNAVFPTQYHDLLNLSGIGEYTAAAIASFSSNAPHAVLDGNVFRVLSRYFGVYTPINSPAGKREFSLLANEMMDEKNPGLYNQAIMDFGSLQCKPTNPHCEACIFRLSCWAYQNSKVSELPVKVKKKQSRNRYFHYFIIEKDGDWAMVQRNDSDIWANLYEFPMVETVEDLNIAELSEIPIIREMLDSNKFVQIGSSIKHILSHQNIYAKFYKVLGENIFPNKKNMWNYFNSKKIDKLAKHKLIVSFLSSYAGKL